MFSQIKGGAVLGVASLIALSGCAGSAFAAPVNTSFKDDLACKSSNIVQFSAALEDHFDIEVPYMELARRKTFGEAGDLMEELFA